MEVQVKHLTKRESNKMDSVDMEIVAELGRLLLLKCISSGTASVPNGYKVSDININYRELITLARSNESFAVPMSWFTHPIEHQQILPSKSKSNPKLDKVEQKIDTAPDNKSTSSSTEMLVTDLTDLNVLSVLIDYDKSKYFNYNRYSLLLTTKDIQHGTFELLLGLLLFNKPSFNIKYVISDKIRLHYGINKKKSIELAEQYSIVPLNNIPELESKDIQSILETNNLQEFLDVLMRYVVLNKDPFLLKFILLNQFKTNRDFCIRQYKLLFHILLEKTMNLMQSMQDIDLEIKFDDLIKTTYNFLLSSLNDESFHDCLMDYFRQWMTTIFTYHFTTEDTKKGFLPCFMLTEISRVQLHLFENEHWKCKDIEYQAFLTWFFDLFSTNKRYLAWGHVLALLTMEQPHNDRQVMLDIEFEIIQEQGTIANNKIHPFSPITVQYYLNLLFKQIVVEYQLASELCGDMMNMYLQTCNNLLQIEYPFQLIDTYSDTSIGSLPQDWIKTSISKLVDMMIKQANEHTMHTLIEMMKPANSDFNENTLSIFLETLESIFIKDWSVRFESISLYVRPEVFWRRHVDQLLSTVFSKIPTTPIQAFGEVFQQACLTVQRIHAFLERAHSEYALQIKMPDLSWFLTDCLENWIYTETSQLVSLGHSCYNKDHFEVISGLTSDGVYSYMSFVNRLVDCVLKINVQSLQTKVAHYLITSLSPSFYEICKLYLRNPMMKSAMVEVPGVEPVIITGLMQYANYQFLLIKMKRIGKKVKKMCPIRDANKSPLNGILRHVYLKVHKESILFAEDFCEKIMTIVAPNCKETLYFPNVGDMRLEGFLDQISYAKKRIRLAPISKRQQYLIEVHMCHHIVNVVESILIGQGHPFRHFKPEDFLLLEEDLNILEDFVKTWPMHPAFDEKSDFRNFRLLNSHEEAIIKVIKLREIVATYFQMDYKSLKEMLDTADKEDQLIIEGVIFHRFSKKV